jgi:hypothetical protein
MKLKVGDVVIATYSAGSVRDGDVLKVTSDNIGESVRVAIMGKPEEGRYIVWYEEDTRPATKLHKYLYGVENEET